MVNNVWVMKKMRTVSLKKVDDYHLISKLFLIRNVVVIKKESRVIWLEL